METKIKCEICGKRRATTKHSKSYNHNNGDFVYLCMFCHNALHLINHRNELDWDYVMKKKLNEVLRISERLFSRYLRRKMK